jgi:hypothetical protein
VLRGRPLQIPGGKLVLISLGVALALSVPVLWLARGRYECVRIRHARSSWVVVIHHLILVAITWLIARSVPRALNIVLLMVAKSRRMFRP